MIRLPHGEEKWEQQREKGLPDTLNFYALAEDDKGRIWAGTDNKGVAIWNGKFWKQYNQTNALLGERIFAIAVSPFNGDTAIATSGGLTIYQPETESWKDYTRTEGLPEDQIASLSFDREGTLWAAFQTSGVASAQPSNRYSQWRVKQTNWYWDNQQTARQPFEAKGKGLPSNFCNAICADSDAVWVGTNSGLGYTKNKADWVFLRGRDYESKNRGLWKSNEKLPGQTSKKVQKNNPSRKNDSTLLPEDYITCFYPSPKGIWIGFREQGICLLNTYSLNIQNINITSGKEKEKLTSITCFVSLPDGGLYAGTYGKGFLYLDHFKEKKPIAALTEIKHPSFPAVSSLKELTEKKEILPLTEKTNTPKTTFFWYEDWATQGDWCERYGRSYMFLCASAGIMGSVADAFGDSYRCVSVKGPHVKKGESGVAGQVIWQNEQADENILYCPVSTTRTLARWSDRGDSVHRSFDGPDLGALIQIPQEKQLVSLYFYDPTPLTDNDLNSSLRDYILEIRKLPADFDLDTFLGIEKDKEMEEEDFFKEPSYERLKEYIPLPVQARSRVKSFAGCGVYKNFIIVGAGWHYVRILKNYSTSTIINGIFMSSLDETKIAVNKLFGKHDGKASYYGVSTPAPPPLNKQETGKLPKGLMELWGTSQNVGKLNKEDILASRKLGIYAYRHLLSTQASNDIRNNWRWRLKIWEQEDRDDFRQQMKKAWRSLQDTNYLYRSSEWANFAPDTTIPFSKEEVRKMSAYGIDWKQYLPNSDIKPKLDIEQMKEWLKDKK